MGSVYMREVVGVCGLFDSMSLHLVQKIMTKISYYWRSGKNVEGIAKKMNHD